MNNCFVACIAGGDVGLWAIALMIGFLIAGALD